jgi:hypothetical protein
MNISPEAKKRKEQARFRAKQERIKRSARIKADNKNTNLANFC